MVQTYSHEINLNGLEFQSNVQLVATTMEGGMNDIPVTHAEFLCDDLALDLGTLVGETCGVHITSENRHKHHFVGTCISAESGQIFDTFRMYRVELRPWLWLLTRSQNNRIFQNQSAMEIIQAVIGAHGFESFLEIDSTASNGKKREYCTQYRETDYDFVKRLIEEEGCYFYFAHTEDKTTLVISASLASHAAPSGAFTFPFRTVANAGRICAINTWGLAETSTTQKVTLRDYNFEEPANTLQVDVKTNLATAKKNESEYYGYPGRHQNKAHGDKIAQALIDSEETRHQTWRGTGDTINLAPGQKFALTDHENADTYMVTRIRQYYRAEGTPGELSTIARDSDVFQRMAPGNAVAVLFDAVQESTPFYIRPHSRRPEISGVQTAVVVTSDGEEQTIDKYGRIKVQFHWDRDGKGNDKSSCWVRTMMPWTGNKWGMVAWPRKGQEVVIQFEEGNPDRPLCIGMLYNANTMPPYALPGNQTRTGIKTNSTKGGGGYNELMFEDKKGDELVRFGAEKDYVQTVQNASHIRVGYNQEEDTKKAKADGDKSMKLEVSNNLDEIIEKGDHTFAIQTGSQKINIKKNKTETITGKSTLTVTGNVAETIKQGNLTREIKLGDQKVEVKVGNYSLDTKLGKIDMTALQSITLKVGANSIKIDQMGVTIKGMMIKIQGTAMLEAKAPMSTIKGDGLLILKGGLTMIN